MRINTEKDRADKNEFGLYSEQFFFFFLKQQAKTLT